MSHPPKVSARKTVANLVTAVSGWATFAVLTGDVAVSRTELGLLLTILVAGFVTWYVPNEQITPWDPPDRGAITLQTVVLILVGLVALVWLAADVDIVTK